MFPISTKVAPSNIPLIGKRYSIFPPIAISPALSNLRADCGELLPGPNSLNCHALLLFAPPAKKLFSYGKLFALP